MYRVIASSGVWYVAGRHSNLMCCVTESIAHRFSAFMNSLQDLYVR
jgi:hypothetical protein